MQKSKVTKEDMLKEYLSMQLLYVEFSEYIESKIKNLLIENNIKFQAVSSRVKSYESLNKKLTEEFINGIKRNIKNMNDLSGVRVVFYDEIELKKFKEILNQEFEIHNYKAPADVMEYDGINVTVVLKNKANKFKDMKCEIQLTTILSHAINEFGHDIVYKDVDELESKDMEEYEKIKGILTDVRKDILKITAKLNNITLRVKTIKNGYQNLEILLSEDIINNIKNTNSFDNLEDVMQKMIEIIPLINKDRSISNKINELDIIANIVKRFSELPRDASDYFGYDTYEYRYTKLLEFLQSYRYIWARDFRNVISILYDIAKKSNFVGKYDRFLEELMNYDKADSARGIAEYNIHQVVFSVISDSELDNHIRLRLAEEYCNLDFSYCEEVRRNKLSIIKGKIPRYEEILRRINTVIGIVLDILLNSNSEEVLNSIININYFLEDTTDLFDENPIYDFFNQHYDEISIYTKNALFNSICMRKQSQLRESDFYKRIKEDRLQILFAMLFNHHIDEPLGADYTGRENYRNEYLTEYVENFNVANIEEVVILLNTIDNVETNKIDMNHASEYLIKIGSIPKCGQKILERKWNEFIFLGVIEQDKDYKYRIDDIDIACRIIKAMNIRSYINTKLMDSLIELSKEINNNKLELELIKLIANNEYIVNDERYKRYFLDRIQEYSKKSIGVIDTTLRNPQSEKRIISDYKKSDIKILIENYKYCSFHNYDEFFLKDLFEKYPEELRALLKCKAINNPTESLFNSYCGVDLSDCSNFDEELMNNLQLCIELLKDNHYYISSYVRYLIGRYNEKIEKAIISHLENNSNYEDYCAIIRLCNFLDASISCWKIYEIIIANVDLGDKLLDEIDCNLFSTTCTGEYGLANSFRAKYDFFNRIKTKDKKVMTFVELEKKRFDYWYHEEKNKRDKDSVINETKYQLENEDNDE